MIDRSEATPAPRGPRKHRGRTIGCLAICLFVVGFALFVVVYEHHNAVTVDVGNGIVFTYTRVTPTHPLEPSFRTVAVADRMPETTIPVSFAPWICLYEGRDPETGHHWVRTSDRWGTIWIDLDESCVSGSRPFGAIKPESHICGLHYRAELGPARETKWTLLGVIRDKGSADPVFTPGAKEFRARECAWED